MRSRDLLRAAVFAVAFVAAGCSSHPSTARPTTVTDAPPAPVTASTPTAAGASTSTSTTTTASAAGSSTLTALVSVSGGDLPADVVAAYKTGGGDLVDPVEWRGRFGAAPVPELSGPGVRLVEATQRGELVDGRWKRTDEFNWLAMSTAGRDDVLDEMARAAGLDATPTTSTAVEQSADCVVRTFDADADGVEWRLQGCSYPRFPRMIAIGVTRTGPSEQAGATLDPTVAIVAGELAGQVSFSEATLGEPGADGSTLRLTVHLATGMDAAAGGDQLEHGSLASWQTFPGDGSLLLSGPTGATWTLSDQVAVYAWAGRW